MRSRASTFKSEYPLLSLRSSSSFLRLLPRLLATSIPRFIFPSITCFRRQFLRKMWPIQLAFRFLISCRIFLCSLIHFKYAVPCLNFSCTVWGFVSICQNVVFVFEAFSVDGTLITFYCITVFLNRRAAARYRALASIIRGPRKLSF